jgi:hypothetical protein
LILILAPNLLLSGCSPPVPPAKGKPQPEYIQPSPSPVTEHALAKKLETYFPADAVVPREQGFNLHQGEANQNHHDNNRPKIWSSEHLYWFSLKEKFLDGDGGLAACEAAINLYLTDIAKKCGELGGVLTVGKSDRNASGFTVSSTYTLPQRTGKIQVTLANHDPPVAVARKVSVLITEDAEGWEK